MRRPAKTVLQPGAIRLRHISKQSQAHPGVSPLHPVSHRNVSFQPLPRPLGLPPYHYDLAEHFSAIGEDITKEKKMVFHVVGDTGGIQDGEFQNNVAAQMIDHLNSGKGGKPLFCYHVGDVVYYTGMRDDYYAQFYEPYSQYDVPIFSIPGNHDGEVDDPTAQVSLDGWIDYFMQAQPDVDPISKDAPRVQLNLPNVYWTLVTPILASSPGPSRRRRPLWHWTVRRNMIAACSRFPFSLTTRPGYPRLDFKWIAHDT